MVLSLFAIPTVVTHLPNIYQEPDNVYDLTWPSLQPCEADIIPPILWLRILRLKEMNTPAQDHTAGVQHSWDGKLGTCDRQAISRNVQHEESHLLHSRSCTCSKAASELLGFLGSHSRQNGSPEDVEQSAWHWEPVGFPSFRWHRDVDRCSLGGRTPSHGQSGKLGPFLRERN